MLFGCTAVAQEYMLVARTGFDFLELPCKHMVAMPDSEFMTFAKLVENGPIPVFAMNQYCPPEVIIAGPGFSLKNAEAYAVKAAMRAEALGVQFVGIGSPFSRILPTAYDHALALRQVTDFLTATADIFGKKNITVCFEALATVYCNFVNHTIEAVRIAKEVNHPYLQIVLDFYNMEHMNEAEMPLETVIPMVRHVHISDDENGDPRKRSYLKPSKKTDHIRRIRRLSASGYNGTITLEIDLPVDINRGRQSIAIFQEAVEHSTLSL